MKTAILMLAALAMAAPTKAEQPYCSRGSQFALMLRYKNDYPTKQAMQHMHELCQSGDLLRVPAETADMFCDMSRQVIRVDNGMMACTYLGAPRQIR